MKTKELDNKLVKIVSPEALHKLVQPVTLPKKVKTLNIDALMDDYSEHFKKDKWPLSLDVIKEELFRHITGVYCFDLIVTEFKKRGIEIGYGKKALGDVIFVNEKKKAKKKSKKK